METLLAGVSKISGQRQVLIRLNWMLEDETRGARDLVELLRMDQGLSARVIAISNTALYRGGDAVSTVEEAVVRIGVWEIRRVLMSSIMREMTLGALRVYNLAPGALWGRSLLVAVGMAALTEETGAAADQCYTTGLLHGAGLIVIDRWLCEKHPLRLPRVGSYDDPCRAARERELIGWTSEEVGAALLESWRFPGPMLEAIRLALDPLAAGEHVRLAARLHLAQWCARAIEARAANKPLAALPEAGILEAAGREPDAIEALLVDVQQRFTDQKAASGVG
ncbi:HDOD domain-containing protein [Congregicoccus parvus]|uniref:HDOD domain-containing protein n=1 Tax=Congregicoccus parvus TaxID=3081749 RepID=UPI003FA56896